MSCDFFHIYKENFNYVFSLYSINQKHIDLEVHSYSKKAVSKVLSSTFETASLHFTSHAN